MAIPQREKVITSLAGEFLVAGQLSLKGYVASLTLKNYPGVDIFCLNPRNGRQAAIQVKTRRGGDLYYIPENVAHLDTPFVFVYIHSDHSIDYFVIPAEDLAVLYEQEAAEYFRAHPNVKKDQPHMVSVKRFQPYKDRWDLLGLE